MRGLPASGKTTKAKAMVESGGYRNIYRINRDLLREMLHFDKWSKKNEEITVDTAYLLAADLLTKGHSVIIDDTNLGERHEEMWKAIADNYEAEFIIKDMMDHTTVGNCLEYNYGRALNGGRGVPEAVIKNMAVQYGYAQLDKVVIVDIDGTVADCSHRRHHVEGDKKEWSEFFDKMGDDTPRTEVYQNAVNDAEALDAEIVFVSARPEDYRSETEQWLRENNMEFDYLLMRRKGDTRPDTEVKFDLYNRYLKQYNVVKVIDDRPSVIEMWRKQGLDVEDVGDGKDF